MKKFASIGLMVFIFIAFSTAAFAETPDWLRRVEVGAEFENKLKPILYTQTVQPLPNASDDASTFFIQPRLAVMDGDPMFNIGMGGRSMADTAIVGFNGFLDHLMYDSRDHTRLGAGVELIGKQIDVRSNFYYPLSTKRVVSRSGDILYYNKIAPGADLEVGVPVPYINWVRFYTQGFYYANNKIKDCSGFRFRLEARLKESVALELHGTTDNRDTDTYGGRIRIRLAFDGIKDLKEWIYTISADPFNDRDLSKLMLIPVERSSRITLEKYTE